jgi:hypothetical protein
MIQRVVEAENSVRLCGAVFLPTLSTSSNHEVSPMNIKLTPLTTTAINSSIANLPACYPCMLQYLESFAGKAAPFPASRIPGAAMRGP